MKFVFLSIVLLLTACTSIKPSNISVTSEPYNATIEVNGFNYGIAPVTLNLECKKKWVGIANSPDGWETDSHTYRIKAIPTNGRAGYTQTKVIDACGIRGLNSLNVHFNMLLEPIQPTNKLIIE